MDYSEPKYDSGDLVRIFEKKQSWLTTQLFRRHIVATVVAEGAGTKHLFSYSDLVRIRIFVILSEEASLAKKWAAAISHHDTIAAAIEDIKDDPEVEAYLYSSRRRRGDIRIHFMTRAEAVPVTLRSDDYAFVINLPKAILWVDNKLAKL